MGGFCKSSCPQWEAPSALQTALWQWWAGRGALITPFYMTGTGTARIKRGAGRPEPEQLAQVPQVCCRCCHLSGRSGLRPESTQRRARESR